MIVKVELEKSGVKISDHQIRSMVDDFNTKLKEKRYATGYIHGGEMNDITISHVVYGIEKKDDEYLADIDILNTSRGMILDTLKDEEGVCFIPRFEIDPETSEIKNLLSIDVSFKGCK